MSKYRVFTRTWWKPATSPGWPGGREPQPGKKSYRNHPAGLDFAQAKDYCQIWNTNHNPGRWSRKAEFESC